MLTASCVGVDRHTTEGGRASCQQAVDRVGVDRHIMMRMMRNERDAGDDWMSDDWMSDDWMTIRRQAVAAWSRGAVSAPGAARGWAATLAQARVLLSLI